MSLNRRIRWKTFCSPVLCLIVVIPEFCPGLLSTYAQHHQAATRIRKEERKRQSETGKSIRTPLIALTASVGENEPIAHPLNPFYDFVPKPFHTAEISLKVKKHLGVQLPYRSLGMYAGSEPVTAGEESRKEKRNG